MAARSFAELAPIDVAAASALLQDHGIKVEGVEDCGERITYTESFVFAGDPEPREIQTRRRSVAATLFHVGLLVGRLK